MSTSWEDEAENWRRWARAPGHDVYRDYSPSFLAELIPPPSGLTLEVGCGEGRVSRDLLRLGHEVFALDSSPTLVHHAKDADPGSDYLIAGAERLPFATSTFTLVVAYNSLQNVGDMPASIREIDRVLKPSGRLCVCIAHPMSDAGRFESGSSSARFIIKESYYGPRRVDENVERDGLEMTFHGLAYSLEEYTRALEQSGFLIDLIREPRPDADAVSRRPDLARWQRVPLFLFLRAFKRGDTFSSPTEEV
jgi:SAM-dependent methyltransferase